MELSKAGRLLAVTKWLSVQRGISIAEVGRLLGYKNNSHFSQVTHGNRPIPEDVINTIVSLDPRINRDYLEGRSDNMLIPGDEGNSGDVIIPRELAQMLSDLTNTIREQQSSIRELQAMIRTFIDKLVNKEDDHADE